MEIKPYYEDDSVRLYHGNMLTVLQNFPAESVDGVFTDPPYSSGGTFRSDRVQKTSAKYLFKENVGSRPDFQGDNKDQRSFCYWSTLWLSECFRIVRSGEYCCLFSDWRQVPTVSDALQAAGWSWRGMAIWDKTEAARPIQRGFRNQAEYVLVASKGAVKKYEDYKPCLPGVFRIARGSALSHHQTEKPLKLMEHLLQILCPPSTILDPFAGSGTTLVAAKKLGHKAIGIEIEERYCEITANRLGQGVLDL